MVAALIGGTGALACAADGDDSVEEGEATCWPEERIPAGAARVDVALAEWAISLSQDTVPAGDVAFAAKNSGALIHEMLVIRTDDVNALPYGEDGSIDEALVPEDDLPGEIAEFGPGSTCYHSFNLRPGRYALFCNIAEGDAVHLKNGMIATFTVTA